MRGWRALPWALLLALVCEVLCTPDAAKSQSLGRVEIGAKAPNFTLRGADGAPHRPSDAAGKLLVLEWTNPVCPYTRAAYRSGAMQALQRQVRARGGVWFAVDTAARTASGWIAPAAARARLSALKAKTSAFLFDEAGAVGRLYGARATPTVYIIDPSGRLRYQGALQSPSDGSPIIPYARMALEDLRRGREVAVSETRPEGCPVEY